MKKLTKKMVVAFVAVVSAVLMSVSLAACGGGAASVKTVYSADPGEKGTAKYLSTGMAMILTNVETITLYDDDTYCLSVSTTLITGLSAITGEGEIINRGTTVTEYYGKYAETEDSGVIMLTLAKPTRVAVANTNTLFTLGLPVGYFDTASWNTETEEAFTAAKETIKIEEVTAETVLNAFAFDETEVAVTNGVFEYIAVSYHNLFIGL